MAEKYKAPKIKNLTPYELNQVQQSLDSYNKLLKIPKHKGHPRNNPYKKRKIRASEAREVRSPYTRGSHGIEDEYRYMVSQGFKPKGMGITEQAAAPPVSEPEPQQTNEQKVLPGQTDDTLAKDTPQADSGYQPPSVEDTFATQIAEMQKAFTQSMQQQMQNFQQMQMQQSDRMAALQQQMQQSMQQSMMQAQLAQQRPQVANVQMAESAAGTPMQIARRGVTGAFGRRGMRIKGLNV